MQLWPPVVDPSTLSRQVWDTETARTVPGVGRALALYGLLGQAPLEAYAGVTPLPRPRLLDRPDPDRTRPHFVKAHVEDYLLHGNAAHLVTARDSAGWPAAVRWYPAHAWSIVEEDGGPAWYLYGRRVNERDVVHVQRGADPSAPWRGVGVVEQHVRALNVAGLQTAAESSNLQSRGTPSVAVITPQRDPEEADLDAAADKWVERYSGPEGKPGFFPNGTQIVPLAWSPNDQQMTEARKMSLVDVANVFNLDGYWLGAPGSSHTYRSPGALYLALLRTSLDGVREELEDAWSAAWLVRGRRVRLDRSGLLVDDLETSIRTVRNAVDGDLWTVAEARTYLGMDPTIDPDNGRGSAPAPAPAPADAPITGTGDVPA